jgi:hypothetical protein
MSTRPRKIRSNFANAQVSSGPRTAVGKARASQNARRHGLNLSVFSDPVLSEQVRLLAFEISGVTANDETFELARRVADAQVDVMRIRQARHDLLARSIGDADYGKEEALYYNAKLLLKNFGRLDPFASLPKRLESMFRSSPQGPDKVAAILSDLTKQLTLMDRYERRALSRRKFAIRAFDAARQQSGMR